MLFGTMPLLLRYLMSRADDRPLTFLDTLRQGELLIVSAVIAADSVGRVLLQRHPEDRPFRPMILIGRAGCSCFSVVMLLVASALYASVSGRIEARLTYNSDTVARDSLLLFGGVVAAGFGVILVTED